VVRNATIWAGCLDQGFVPTLHTWIRSVAVAVAAVSAQECVRSISCGYQTESNGAMPKPTGHGLGIEVDESVVRRFAIPR
jgi:hypothetical protein